MTRSDCGATLKVGGLLVAQSGGGRGENTVLSVTLHNFQKRVCVCVWGGGGGGAPPGLTRQNNFMNSGSCHELGCTKKSHS